MSSLELSLVSKHEANQGKGTACLLEEALRLGSRREGNQPDEDDKPCFFCLNITFWNDLSLEISRRQLDLHATGSGCRGGGRCANRRTKGRPDAAVRGIFYQRNRYSLKLIRFY